MAMVAPMESKLVPELTFVKVLGGIAQGVDATANRTSWKMMA